MLHLTKGNTENIYFTGFGTAEISYNFYFKNRLTEEAISILYLPNLSILSRYQKVVIIVDNYFENCTTGLWDYTIFDAQETLVESGLMYLHPSTKFNPIEYVENSNNFITYNGE